MMRSIGASLPPHEILLRTEVAHRLAATTVSPQISLSIWRNEGRDVDYDCAKGHTFSFYLKGGYGSRRKTHSENFGGPEKICIIPDGAYSRWGHSGPLVFLHLYVNDDELRRRFVETTEKDARLCRVPEIDYGDIRPVKNAFRALFLAWRSSERLAIESALTELLTEIYAICHPPARVQLKGGLSNHSAKTIREYIEGNLDRSLTLRELSRQVNLSEFHFQKMFRASFSISPARWVLFRRIARAREMLARNVTIAEISTHCGFSDQSHFTKSFRKATGMTPGTYRALIARKTIRSGLFAQPRSLDSDADHVNQNSGNNNDTAHETKTAKGF